MQLIQMEERIESSSSVWQKWCDFWHSLIKQKDKDEDDDSSAVRSEEKMEKILR